MRKRREKKKRSCLGRLFAFVGFVVFMIALVRRVKQFMEVIDYLWGDGLEGDYGPISFSEQKKKKEDNKAKKLTKPKSKVSNSFKLTDRQEEIYQLISSDGEVSMSEVTSVINDVSTRTLRRDMTKLENLGLIKRVGKTKDSVYKLKE